MSIFAIRCVLPSGINSVYQDCPSCGTWCIAEVKQKDGQKKYVKCRHCKHMYWLEA